MNPPAALGAGAVRVQPRGPVDGRLAVPGSKSLTIRHVLLAALADGRSVLTGVLEADDTLAVRDAVTALGAAVETRGQVAGAPVWVVRGTGGALRAPRDPIDCRLSGTTLRILTAVATHADGPTTITGSAALRRRPIGVLVDALGALGGQVSDEDGYPPVRTGGGGLNGGRVTVDVTTSSQFVSALLLAAPLARRPVEVRTTGVAASAYIDLTARALRNVDVEIVEVVGNGAPSWKVTPGVPRAREIQIEHDASAACHVFAVAMTTAGGVTVTNAGPTRQPDANLTQILISMGASVLRDGDRLTVTGPQRLSPVDVDLATMPDQVTTVATLAALADGVSHIRGVGVTRGHETDRLAALSTELAKIGADVREEPDALHIVGIAAGKSAPSGHDRARAADVRLATYGDHRLAMAFAALGARLDGVVIEDPACVDKTYPGFWHDIATMGAAVLFED